jgi:hypothetical protein
MFDLEVALIALMGLGLVLGTWGILWARMSPAPKRVGWGQTVFVATLIGLGIAGSVAAFHRADGLAPLGLLAGFLVIGMLWEMPRENAGGIEPLSLADEA